MGKTVNTSFESKLAIPGHDACNPCEHDKKENKIQIHATMVEVSGVGVLLIGDSGVGKSETALELISRGHKLVADDAVVVTTDGAGDLSAAACAVNLDLLEIRGLGIINVRDVFGSGALVQRSKISLSVRLSRAGAEADESQSAFDLKTQSLAGKDIPNFVITVKPGRNIPVLIETAVRILNNKQ